MILSRGQVLDQTGTVLPRHTATTEYWGYQCEYCDSIWQRSQAGGAHYHCSSPVSNKRQTLLAGTACAFCRYWHLDYSHDPPVGADADWYPTTRSLPRGTIIAVLRVGGDWANDADWVDQSGF